MSESPNNSAKRPEPDRLLVQLADYALNYAVESEEAMHTAHHCLLDSLACALQALHYPACTKLLGPVVPDAEMAHGARVPGTSYRLDPVTAAFNIGSLVRWLDYNDTWLAAEWGHPSDNLGAILAVADWHSQAERRCGRAPLVMRDVLTAMIKAHEIQGVLALDHSFNALGLDHVLLVRVASTAAVCALLGADRQTTIQALSQAFADGACLRTYRHAPNTGSRKSWAAGDATSRAVRLALISQTGEMGYPSVLSAETWGFEAVLMRGEPLALAQAPGSYVMENVLFKIDYPAEFHGQTAIEAAVSLHPEVVGRLDDIERIEIETQAAGKRIIDKTGPLNNPADRDHCLQYMVAIGLLRGGLRAEDYEDDAAADPRIDQLRDKMRVEENKAFTEAYFDPEKRAIGNAVTVHFSDGSASERVQVDYPLGHRRRRDEGLPRLRQKFERALRGQFAGTQLAAILEAVDAPFHFQDMPVPDLMELFSR